MRASNTTVDARTRIVATRLHCRVLVPLSVARRYCYKNTFQQLWRFATLCSPLIQGGGGEHGKAYDKEKIKMFGQRRRLCFQRFENLFDRIVIR